jgi:hypothetical protein
MVDDAIAKARMFQRKAVGMVRVEVARQGC